MINFLKEEEPFSIINAAGFAPLREVGILESESFSYFMGISEVQGIK